ncbi:WG repeat-containing protein [Acetivibrio cellulolyticus]|uniref:WG repeat-containing protein n=1 Tax=Acetivibrio cellulolyticus TaxID=35830 RepID=UPI0001E2F5ED|nr:WG repeat-containing protein [Acetivibrio cellulolyticus]
MSNAFGELGNGRYKGNIIYPIEKNNKIGFIDKDGKIVIEPEYGDMLFVNEGMIAFLDPLTDRWGYMDSNFNVIFKPQIKIITPEKFSEGLAGYCDEFKQKWGYIDKYGNVVISPRFAEAFEFRDNYATVVVNELQESCWGRPISGDRWGAIDINGNFVIEPKYDFLKNNWKGLFTASKDDLWGCIDKDNNTVIPFIYEKLSLNEFGEGLSLAKYKDKWGVIDIKNNVVIDFKIDDFLDPLEGCYGIGWGETSSGNVKAYKFDNKWVLFNTNGIPIKTLEGYFVVKEYINGYAMAVTEKEECHIIDEAGNIIFSRKRNYAKTPGPFSEGLAAVNASDINDPFEEKYCYIDCNGKVVINPGFDSADPFYENYAVVGMYTYGYETQYGIIDRRGEYLIKPFYDYITRFYNGIACVKLNNKHGYVNTSGKLIYEPEGFLSDRNFKIYLVKGC